MSRHTLARRLDRLLEGAALPPPENLYVLSGEDFRLDPRDVKPSGARLLEACAAKGFNPDFVIVETLRRVLHGDENEAQDIRTFWRLLEPLHDHGRRAVMVSHHMSKPREGSNTRDRASGSGDIIGGADASVSVLKTKKDGQERITIESQKLREADQWSPKSLRVMGTGETEPVRIESVA